MILPMGKGSKQSNAASSTARGTDTGFVNCPAAVAGATIRVKLLKKSANAAGWR